MQLKGCLFVSPGSPFHLCITDWDFLLSAEKEEKRATTANELIDWVRLLNENLGVNELRRVAAILENLWKPSIADLIQNVDPASGCLWEGLDIVRRFDVLRP